MVTVKDGIKQPLWSAIDRLIDAERDPGKLCAPHARERARRARAHVDRLLDDVLGLL